MSSDNYIYVRRYRGRYVVTDESASADRPTPIERQGGNRGVFFDTLAEAIDYASTQYAEYGMRLAPGLRLVGPRTPEP